MNRREFLRLSGNALVVAALPWHLGRSQPRGTVYGVDVCPYCSMTVSDLRFAAQVITPTGVVHSYDAIECLADHLLGHGPLPPMVTEVYLANYAGSSREEVSYVPAANATVIHHPRLRSPMGGGLASFLDEAAALDFAQANRLSDAQLLTWEQLLAAGEQRPWVPDY